jgi:hypothetical protein
VLIKNARNVNNKGEARGGVKGLKSYWHRHKHKWLRVSKKLQKLPYPRGIGYPKNTKLNNATTIEVFLKTELVYILQVNKLKQKFKKLTEKTINQYKKVIHPLKHVHFFPSKWIDPARLLLCPHLIKNQSAIVRIRRLLYSVNRVIM